jgi:glycosyltransferase involved in cell wall biosynthesis
MDNLTSPLVSIIIPLYNAESYIEQTIQSVIEQTYQHLEIIVVDDFSNDQSFDIVSNIKSDKIKLVKNKKKGACAARNYGFELSKGDYIQYLDADDILSKNKINSQLLLLLKNNHNSIASCGWEKFTTKYQHLKARKQLINKSYDSPLQWLLDTWSGKGMGLISIWLTPRNLIKQAGLWNENLLINQDGEFFCRVLLQASKVIYCDNALVYYRINPSSITQSKRSNEKLKSQLASYKMYETHLQEKLQSAEVRKALGNIYLKFIYHNNQNSKKLAQLAWSYFYNLKIGKPWGVGGKKFKFISSIFGFNFALKIIKLLD